MKKPIFLMLTAMLLCSAPNQIFSQTETTPELGEIFKDSTLTRLILEEVGFYEKTTRKKAWRLVYLWPEKKENGMWRHDSLGVMHDVQWINDSTSFIAWAEDTTLFTGEYKAPIYEPISAPEKPVFQDLPESFVTERLSQWEMDTLGFLLDKNQVERSILSFERIEFHKSMVVFKCQECEIYSDKYTYAVRFKKKGNEEYHFFDTQGTWVNGFIIDKKNLRVWNTAPPAYKKMPNFKKLFKE